MFKKGITMHLKLEASEITNHKIIINTTSGSTLVFSTRYYSFREHAGQLQIRGQQHVIISIEKVS